MKHLFIPYELALKAKEAGFNEKCLAYFSIGEHILEFDKYGIKKEDTHKDCVIAPLYQQIIDWFRDKHSIEIAQDLTKTTTWSFSYSYLGNEPEYLYSSDKSYYEAYTKAIEQAFTLIKKNEK